MGNNYFSFLELNYKKAFTETIQKQLDYLKKYCGNMIYILIIIGIFSFNLCTDERISISQLEEVRKITRPILNDVMKAYKLKYKFYTEEIVNKINALHFDFSAQRASNIECARHDIVKITEFLKNKINTSNNIINFFNNYPISEKQLYVWIEYLGNPENKSDFQRVMLIDGRISYSPTYGNALFREDYNTAKEAVLNSSK